MAEQRSGGVLVGIGIFKLVKVAILLAAGFAALNWLHRNPEASLWRWIERFNIDPARPLVEKVLGKAETLGPRQLWKVAITSFTYAALMTVEGVGLLMRKRWAEYFTVVITGSLLPFEIWELHKRFTGERVAVLVINAAIVVYLIARLVKEKKEPRQEPEGPMRRMPARA